MSERSQASFIPSGDCPPHRWIIEPVRNESKPGKSEGQCVGCGETKKFINYISYFYKNQWRSYSQGQAMPDEQGPKNLSNSE